MKTNKKSISERVAAGQGSIASKITAKQSLQRCVMTNLLWEDLAYENGVLVVDKIKQLVPKVSTLDLKEIVIEASINQKLRHVPLLLIREMARYPQHKSIVSSLLYEIIRRPDQLTEFLSLYWMDGKCPISKQVKLGLASAFTKFNEYSLAKYNRKENIKLKDVLFMTHAKPLNSEQESLWKRLINDQLTIPDTWEVELSQSTDKKASWERLLTENKLGVLALLRNLRNMVEANVSVNLIRNSIIHVNPEWALPINFIAAATHAPQFRNELEQLMFQCLSTKEKLKGKTVFLVDVSGSMTCALSAKSQMTRLNAAASLTTIIRELCEQPIVYVTAGCDGSRIHKTKQITGRGFDLSDKISNKTTGVGHGGIFINQCVKYTKDIEQSCDRLIVLTDSQDMAGDDPNRAEVYGKYNYLFDISSHTKGVGYGTFTVINGWSERLVDYIQAFEKNSA